MHTVTGYRQKNAKNHRSKSPLALGKAGSVTTEQVLKRPGTGLRRPLRGLLYKPSGAESLTKPDIREEISRLQNK
jgi:hypothetical protein